MGIQGPDPAHTGESHPVYGFSFFSNYVTEDDIQQIQATRTRSNQCSANYVSQFIYSHPHPIANRISEGMYTLSSQMTKTMSQSKGHLLGLCCISSKQHVCFPSLTFSQSYRRQTAVINDQEKHCGPCR